MLRRAAPGDLGRDVDVIDLARRRRNGNPILAHACKMLFDRLANRNLHFLHCVGGRDATGQIWNVCRKIGVGFLDHDGVAHGNPHFLRPDCFRMLLSVPGAIV